MERGIDVFPFLLTVLLLPIRIHCQLQTLKGKVVTGIYSEETPHSFILYEKVVPIVYEFRVKNELWSSFQTGFSKKFKVLPKLQCHSDMRSQYVSTADWTFTCPLFYHVNEFLKEYKANFTDINPMFRRRTRQPATQATYQKFSHHPSIKFDDCDQVIARQWKGVYNRNNGLYDYRSILEKCNTLPNHFEEAISDYNYDTNAQFESMKLNFANTFFLNQTNPRPGEMVNNLLSIQTLQLLTVFSELSRLREAQHSCRNRLIPLSIISSDRLLDTLSSIKARLLPLKYSLPTEVNIQRLLQLPIADCILSPNSFTVQILLPVVRNSVSFKLLKFHHPQFLYRDQICTVKSGLDVSPATRQHEYLFDMFSKTLIRTHCYSKETDLCLIPDQTQRPLVNKCIYEVLNASFTGIRDHCWLHCENLEKNFAKSALPLIQRVSPTKFLVVVSEITTMLVKCEGKPDELVTPQEFGAVEITLPCNCHIMYHAEVFHSRAPCGSNLHIKHVVPEHMVNSSLIKLNKFFLDDLTGRVNLSLIEEVTSQNVEEYEDSTLDLIDLDDLANESDYPSLNFHFLSNTDKSANASDSNKLAFKVASAMDAKSLLLIAPHERVDNCEASHLALWVMVACQLFLMVIVVIYFHFKLQLLKKKIDYNRSTVCYSVSQMTNLDEK